MITAELRHGRGRQRIVVDGEYVASVIGYATIETYKVNTPYMVIISERADDRGIIAFYHVDQVIYKEGDNGNS